jgi:PqqD family protein of HPr-rel-A system
MRYSAVGTPAWQCALRWHAPSAELLALRELDGELVVYNDASGSTHLLEPLAGEVLRTLVEAGSGMNIADLVTKLRGGAADEDISEWSAAIEAVLSEFQRLGLAEPEQS